MEEQAEVYMNNHFYNSYSNNLSDMNLSYALLSMIKTAGYAVIVLIALIALINVVNIISSNVTGRTSELAMLRACGMSKKQLNKLMLTESLFYAVMAGIASLLIDTDTLYDPFPRPGYGRSGLCILLSCPHKVHRYRNGCVLSGGSCILRYPRLAHSKSTYR